MSDAPPFDLAALIKQFFRELPDPLLTTKLHDTFLKCQQLQEERDRVQAMLLVCHLLPLHHLTTLRYTMLFLRRVAECSDSNKMDVPNLAVCMAPNLMYVMPSKSDKVTSKEDLIQLQNLQTTVIQYLIANAENIGMVSADLHKRTTAMGECFSEDELLEKSDANINESTSKSTKKKKKRSGSFQGEPRKKRHGSIRGEPE